MSAISRLQTRRCHLALNKRNYFERRCKELAQTVYDRALLHIPIQGSV
jgi:hypothetical protein